MMSDVFLIGAGGLAREIVSWNSVSRATKFNIKGAFDDNLNAWDAYQIKDLRIIGTIDQAKQVDDFFISIMDCHIKESIVNLFLGLRKTFHRYIDENVLVGLRSIISEGVIIMPNVSISCDVHVGKFVLINNGSQIGHDCRIGDFSSIMANVDLGGGVVLGDSVFIGSGATILPGVQIAANTRIGAGSVVVKSIKKPGTYFGNPAKKIF